MKKHLLLLTLISISYAKLNAQFFIPIQPWATDVKNRVLVVELREENQKKVKKLSKKNKQELEEYRNSILKNNTNLKDLIPVYWPFENEIIFRPTSEVEKLVKKKDDRYMILDCRWAQELRQSAKVYYSWNVYTALLYYPEYGKKLFYRYAIDNNKDGESHFLAKGQYVFKISMPDYFMNPRDLKFAFQQFDEFIEKAKTEGYPKKMNRFAFKTIEFDAQNIKILKNKTLLVPKELLLVEEQEIAKFYPSKFKVVPLNEIDNLLSNDTNSEYAYYQIVWSDATKYWTVLIIDNSTGKILAENPTFDKKAQLRLGIPIGEKSVLTAFKTANANFVINEKHLITLRDEIENQ